MSGQSILFVDDEIHILTSIKRLLRKEPYTIHTAVGGQAGLELLEKEEVQLVVSDQRMPEMTGVQFLQQVKQLYPNTIRVVLSGYAEAGAIVEAINQGEVYRFLGKPWDDEQLRLTFRQCLEQYDLLEENRNLEHQVQLQIKQLQSLNQQLESSVEERTLSLQFSQEVLFSLPLMVMGISLEEEIVLINDVARQRIQGLSHYVPGMEMDEILPEEALQPIRDCFSGSAPAQFSFQWQDLALKARPALLGDASAPRGCVLLLEEDN